MLIIKLIIMIQYVFAYVIIIIRDYKGVRELPGTYREMLSFLLLMTLLSSIKGNNTIVM